MFQKHFQFRSSMVPFVRKCAACSATLVVLAATCAPSSQVERTAKTLPGEELTVDLQSGGAVRVQGWDHDSILVRAYFPGESHTQIVLDSGPGGATLRSHDDAAQVPRNNRFEIRVPHQYNLSIKSTGGELLISDLNGTFRGTTQGGRIVIERASGSAELFTAGGEVRVTDSELTGSITTAKGPAITSNVKGDIRVSSRSRR